MKTIYKDAWKALTKDMEGGAHQYDCWEEVPISVQDTYIKLTTKPKQGFMKNDIGDNKPMMHLIDAKFKEELAMLLTLGGFKYDFDNWRKAKKTEVIRYRNALERHLLKRDIGEYIDEDTGLPHTICIAFNAMALHYFDLKFKQDNSTRQLYIRQLNRYKRKKLESL